MEFKKEHNIHIHSFNDEESNITSEIDLRNLLGNKSEILASSTKDNLTVLITSTVDKSFPIGSGIERHGRIFLVKNKIPVPTGFWMDWPEDKDYKTYNLKSKKERAQIETKNQFNYPINEQYDEWFKTTYIENKSTGGLLVGETDKDGHKGIKVIAQEGSITMGGGEAIINEEATKENCEELSRINQSTGGVKIPCEIKDVANTTDSNINPKKVITANDGAKINTMETEEKYYIVSDDEQGTNPHIIQTDSLPDFEIEGPFKTEQSAERALKKYLRFNNGGKIVSSNFVYDLLKSHSDKIKIVKDFTNMYGNHQINIKGDRSIRHEISNKLLHLDNVYSGRVGDETYITIENKMNKGGLTKTINMENNNISKDVKYSYGVLDSYKDSVVGPYKSDWRKAIDDDIDKLISNLERETRTLNKFDIKKIIKMYKQEVSLRDAIEEIEADYDLPERKNKGGKIKEYELNIIRQDGTTDNPIFDSLEAAQRAKKDYESLGYQVTMKLVDSNNMQQGGRNLSEASIIAKDIIDNLKEYKHIPNATIYRVAKSHKIKVTPELMDDVKMILEIEGKNVSMQEGGQVCGDFDLIKEYLYDLTHYDAIVNRLNDDTYQLIFNPHVTTDEMESIQEKLEGPLVLGGQKVLDSAFTIVDYIVSERKMIVRVGDVMAKGGKIKKSIKSYTNVKVGDMAMENPDAGGEWNNKIGIILWKGTYSELKKSKYSNLDSDLEDLDPSEYDLVVVRTTGFDGGPTLFNYYNDPSGVVVFQSMVGGGKIPNNYEGKSDEEVWKAWSEKQKEHFYRDHKDQVGGVEFSKIKNMPYEQLPQVVKYYLSIHTERGQYKEGGMIDEYAKGGKMCPVGTEIQTILFKKDKFTLQESKQWLEKHDYKHTKVDVKSNTYRFRQERPSNFRKNSLRTIDFTTGVKAVIGCPKRNK